MCLNLLEMILMISIVSGIKRWLELVASVQINKGKPCTRREMTLKENYLSDSRSVFYESSPSAFLWMRCMDSLKNALQETIPLALPHLLLYL